MTVSEQRISGEFGTVEYHANQGRHRPYRASEIPTLKLADTAITAQAAAPSAEQRAKKQRIEREQHRPTRKPNYRIRSARVRYVGVSRDNRIGISVKVRGVKPQTYWLPYKQALDMWQEFSTEPFPSLV